MNPDPVLGALFDPSKRRVGAQIIGQAYVVAQTSRHSNAEALEKIAEALMARKELFGDELVHLLDSVGIRIPELDYSDDSIWPSPFFSISRPATGARRESPRRERRSPREPDDRSADCEAGRRDRG